MLLGLTETQAAAFLDYPREYRRTIVFIGGVGAASSDATAARSYLKFVTGPRATPAIEAHRLSPA
jgi:hypothetical protein